MDQAWTDRQRHAYQRARRWTEEELVPYAPGQAFSVWYARVGHDMFDRLEPAWLWWSAEKPDPEGGVSTMRTTVESIRAGPYVTAVSRAYRAGTQRPDTGVATRLKSGPGNVWLCAGIGYAAGTRDHHRRPGDEA